MFLFIIYNTITKKIVYCFLVDIQHNNTLKNPYMNTITHGCRISTNVISCQCVLRLLSVFFDIF